MNPIERLGVGLAILGLGIALFVGLPPPWWPEMPPIIVHIGVAFGVVVIFVGSALILQSVAAARQGHKMWPMIAMIFFGVGFVASVAWYFWPGSESKVAELPGGKDTRTREQRLAVGCYQEILPKTLAADEGIQILNLFPLPIENGGGGLATQYSRSGQAWKWPVSDPMDAAFLSAYRCEITNYGSLVIDVEMMLDLTFYEAVPVTGQENSIGHGDVKLHRSWPISIQTIDSGRDNAFRFYIINQTPDIIAHVLMPKAATLRSLDDGQRTQVTLTVTQLGGESALLLWPPRKRQQPTTDVPIPRPRPH